MKLTHLNPPLVGSSTFLLPVKKHRSFHADLPLIRSEHITSPSGIPTGSVCKATSIENSNLSFSNLMKKSDNPSFKSPIGSTFASLRRLAAFVIFTASIFSAQNAFGQITQVGTATTAANSGTMVTINKPTGVVSGHLMIALITENETSNNSDIDAGDIVAPAGWTPLGTSSIEFGADNGNNEAVASVFYRIAGASEGASYAFTLDPQATGGYGTIFAYSGVDATTPIDASGAFSAGATGTALSATSITTTTANAMVFMLTATSQGAAITISGWTTTSPGALTEIVDASTTNGNDSGVGAASAIKAAAGATGNGTATASGSLRHTSRLIALRLACTPPTVNPITGASTLCVAATTTYSSTTPGGVWSTSNNSIATINSSSGLATGVPVAGGSGGLQPLLRGR